MSTAARRRLMRDFKRMQTDPPAGVSASPLPDNVMTWNAVIIGPADTPFEDGTFRLVMHFEEQYPNKPPSVKFLSQMFHPNVYATGELCLDILQNRWSPTYDVAAVLTSIQRCVELEASVCHLGRSSAGQLTLMCEQLAERPEHELTGKRRGI